MSMNREQELQYRNDELLMQIVKLKAELAAARKLIAPPCTWSEDDEGNWVTTCGCNVSISPEDMKFCCCCGGALVMKGEE